MKRAVSFFITAVMCVCFSGCVDFYAGKRPSDQAGTNWVCSEPEMYFLVDEAYGDLTGTNTWGEVTIAGETTEIAVGFKMGTEVVFRPVSAYDAAEGTIDGDNWLFLGTCNFSTDVLTVKITDNTKGFLPEGTEKLVFLKLAD